jgi:outer membrane protein assembly factor BamB
MKVNHADSVLKLSVKGDGSLAVADAFRPYNAAAIDMCDADLAATGTMLLPSGGRLVASGKQGVVYVLNTANLGHGTASESVDNSVCYKPNDGRGGFNTTYGWKTNGDAVVQAFKAVTPVLMPTATPATPPEKIFGHVHGSPVYADLPGGLQLYVWPEMDNLKQFAWTGSQFSTPAAHESTGVPKIDGMPGGALSISTLGAGDAIVWATRPKSADAWAPSPKPGLPSQPGITGSVPQMVQGSLFAFDANDVTKPLWSSDMKPQDAVGEYAKFSPPTIFNGRVYVPTFSGQIQVYGICGKPSVCK